MELTEKEPTKEDTTAVVAKNSKDIQMPEAGKQTATTDAANPLISAADIPIISLSDGEEAIAPPPKIAKKRRTLGGSTGEEEEQRFRLKRRKIKVAGAPKMPLTGYVRYMNDRRESLRKEQPSKTAIEHTKIIGEEWQQLPEPRKAPYMKAAEVDKQRYLSELHTFLKARPDVLACELAKNKKVKVKTTVDNNKSILKEKIQVNDNGPSAAKIVKEAGKEKLRSNNSDKEVTPPPPQPPPATTPPVEAVVEKQQPQLQQQKTKRPPSPVHTSTAVTVPVTFAQPMPGEIPIFTNEFLEHNKITDMELRTLRKSKADLEQQNAVLEKHVENMKFGVEKMTNENDELQEKNRLLEIYLDRLKRKLVQALGGLAIPTEPNGATVDNIDKYMDDLYKMTTSNTHGPASLNKAKDIIRKLDLQIQL